ncbi:MAG: DEAD/DEAH box helicase family protein [Deltaproteobacteria bacterium]|nr:DEAD/DEAH box helicase family protein [Deltaproteobacteria bacterium]
MSPTTASTPEDQAREQIDAMLEQAGWAVQSRDAMNLAAAPGVAVREFQTAVGPMDYALFVGNRLCGVIEAKRVGVPLAAVEAQTRDYARHAPKHLQVPVRPLPFLYESTGVETMFTNGLDPTPRGRRVFAFHQPTTLDGWLAHVAPQWGRPPEMHAAPTLQGRLQRASLLDSHGMWPAQIRAVENLEKSLCTGRRRALVQMATGSGKTFTAITSIYRLVREGAAKRVLFLVDRGNLGRQALKEFQAYTTPDDGRKFSDIYNVANLSSNTIDPVNKVVIGTIQRLYSILRGDPDYDEGLEEGSAFVGGGSALRREAPPVVYNAYLPPEFFDVIVIDECHRSIYTVWRQVLEYFDAALIGLTATPASHTYAFFERNVVSEYTHVHAVRDRVNVPYEVFEIRTRVTAGGAKVVAEPHAWIGKRDRQTRAMRWEQLDEDLEYGASDVDRSVVVPDQIRTVLRELKARMFTDLFPGREVVPKTLLFAKSDDHAEDVLRILREEWNLSNEEAIKITYRPERQLGDAARRSASRKPEDLISAFRTSPRVRVAVTVDMIATGTDIKPLECVVFLRSVKSKALFEQMKGRGVRVIPDADFQAVTPDAPQKTHFVIVDCVGVMDGCKSDPPLDRERGKSLAQLLELVRSGHRSDEVLGAIASRLDRVDRKLDDEQRRQIEAVSGGASLREIVAGMLDRLDPIAQELRLRERLGLPADAERGDDVDNADDGADEAVDLLEDPEHLALRSQVVGEMWEQAAAPLAYNPELCTALLEVRRQQEVTIDVLTLDEVTHSGARQDLTLDYAADQALVSAFEAFCQEQKDALDALSLLYERPYGQRLSRAQLMDLLGALQRPPRRWTGEALWAAYERVEKDRVRGASGGRMLTDLISLVRHAMGVEAELVSYAEVAAERFDGWVLQQEQRGRRFTEEQLGWLRLVRDRIVVDLEVRLEDFDQTPFVEKGGLGKVWAVFGEELEGIVAELNRELVA